MANFGLVKSGRQSVPYQDFLVKNKMDKESFYEEMKELLPASEEERNSIYRSVMERVRLLILHSKLTSGLLDFYKNEGSAGLKALQHFITLEMDLLEYRKKIEADGRSPLEDDAYMRASKHISEYLKLLNDLADKRADRELKRKEVESNEGFRFNTAKKIIDVNGDE